MTSKDRVPVFGSERAPLKGAKAVGKLDAEEEVKVTIRVKSRTAGKKAAAVTAMATRLPGQRQVMSREEFERAHAADPEDMAKIEDFAHEHDLTVVEADPDRRTVVVAGPASAVSKAFGTELKRFAAGKVTYRGRTGPVTLPPEIAPMVEAVLGLDNRPVAKPHFQVRKNGNANGGGGGRGAARGMSHSAARPRAQGGAFLPTELAQLYNFPTGGNGQGQCIAIIELGGGYRRADLKAYFHKLGIPMPRVSAVSVDGARNAPGDDADGEVMLDIEVAGAVAPGARVVVYFAPNTDDGFLNAITRAIHDKVRRPSVISISWGGPESNWTQQSMETYDQAFQSAAAMGVTVCAAAGDNGSDDGVGDHKGHVDFPASSPFVLACGGTRVTEAAGGGTIGDEVVWNDGPNSATGGGVSAAFPRPTWQATANVPTLPAGTAGRGVPDIAGDADPNTGYRVRVDGQDEIIGGTSAVAPLWAGLIALMNQQLGQPAGYLNPLLYGPLANTTVCRDITEGNNGDFEAAAGWDPCTGWGSPDGSALLSALQGQTPHARPAAMMEHAEMA